MPQLDRYYKNKVAVVTGAGSGIGQSIAQLLGKHGARVHCADIDQDAAKRTAGQLDNAVAYAVDVGDADAVAKFADEVFAADGRVDLLFNNAGIGHGGLFVDTELADWRQTMDINVMGVVHGIHAFLPRMQQQAGRCHIVNTASGAGLIPMPRTAAYCASKHAIVGLSQCLASELHDSEIDVTILCPGTINTNIVKRTQMRGESAQKHAQTVEYYEQKGASPDQVASDVLRDAYKGRLFCVTPRNEVGLGWILQRISPEFTQRILRRRAKAIMGES